VAAEYHAEMARWLFTIREPFEVRGCIVAIGLVPIGEERFRVGDPLELRRPDRSRQRTQIMGIEFMSPPPVDHALAVVFPKHLTKDDLPIGAEVWSVDS
jgi:hypothetical protein